MSRTIRDDYRSRTLLEDLRSEFDTSAVPGRFFEIPEHFRIGTGVNTEMFAEGLNRISCALSWRRYVRLL